MMLLCGLIGRANGMEFPAAYWQRLERMLEFIAAMMDCGGNVPMIGDADDAVMVRFDPSPDFCPYRSLLATGAVLFGRPDFKIKAGCFDAKSSGCWGARPQRLSQAWTLICLLCRCGGCSPTADITYSAMPFETQREVRLVADVGPLGYLSIAAHGHADALAFTLAVSGKEILIDPGTYAYHTQKKWRDYFRGTSAHNTVRVDGMDQSVIGGNFMWVHHARSVCESWESDACRDRLVAHMMATCGCGIRCVTGVKSSSTSKRTRSWSQTPWNARSRIRLNCIGTATKRSLRQSRTAWCSCAETASS